MWEQRVEALKKALHAAEVEKEAAVGLAAERVAPEEVDEMRMALEVGWWSWQCFWDTVCAGCRARG